GLAVLPGNHAHDFLAFHFRLEGAADAAIGAGRDDGVLGLPHFDHGFLDERRRGAGLYAGAAGHAVAGHEIVFLARRDAGVESAPGDRQCESALHFFAGADTAAAYDALGRIIGEIRVGIIDGVIEVIGAVVAVAHIAQADHAGHVLEFAVAIGRAGEAIQRVVRDVQFHDAAPQFAQLGCFRPYHHAVFHRSGTGCWLALPAFYLHEAKPA